MGAGHERWQGAIEALAALANPHTRLAVGLVLVRGGGPVRDFWLDCLGSVAGPPVRVPIDAGPDVLFGSVDVEASLIAGRTIQSESLLDRAKGGTLLVRTDALSPAFATALADAVDRRLTGLIVLLSEDDEPIRAALAERIGVTLDLRDVSWIANIGPAPVAPDPIDTYSHDAYDDSLDPALTADQFAALDAFARRMDAAGMEPTIGLVRVSRSIAAADGRNAVALEDMAKAIRLRYGVALRSAPKPEAEDQPAEDEMVPSEPEAPAAPGEHSPPDEADADDGPPADGRDIAPSPDTVLEALTTILAIDLDDVPSSRGTRATGGTGASGAFGPRGRSAGLSARPPYHGARIDIAATLRAAAPWQRLRGTDGRSGRLRVRVGDFRYTRRRPPGGTTIVFAVDASGSAASERLAEAKGAVETLLAKAYSRRDEVALIAFRGARAELVLAPTRGLVAARRALGILPGGGGTPLASAIALANEMAFRIGRSGRSALCVFLTDGRGNVAIDGRTGRSVARPDEERAASAFARTGTPALVIDTAARPGRHARSLADGLHARLIALPHADGRAIARTVGDAMEVA